MARRSPPEPLDVQDRPADAGAVDVPPSRMVNTPAARGEGS
jgi:hypothetical protein